MLRALEWKKDAELQSYGQQHRRRQDDLQNRTQMAALQFTPKNS